MDLFIQTIIALGIFAIIWWVVTALGLPRPFVIVLEVIVAIVAIVAIVFLYRLF